MSETLGQRIRRMRKERNLSQSDLGEVVGCTISWISTIEADKAAPSADLVNKMANAFRVPVRELLQDEDQHMEMTSRLKLIEVLLESHQPEEAEAYIAELQDLPDLAPSHQHALSIHLAGCRYEQKRYDEVLEILEPLVSQLESANYHDFHTISNILNRIGNAYLQKEDHTKAYYNYKKALDLTSRFPEFNQLSAYIHYNLGLTLRRKGRAVEATNYLETAGAYFKETDDLKNYASSLFVQGIAYKNNELYEQAADLFNQSLKIYQALNHKALSHEVRLALAANITYHHDPAEAMLELDKCLAFFEQEQDAKGMVFVLSKKASILLETEGPESCQPVLDQALQMIEEHALSECHEVGDLYLTIATYHYSISKYNNSIDNALKSSELFDILGLHGERIRALKIVVESYQALKDFEQALYYQTLRSNQLEKLNQE